MERLHQSLKISVAYLSQLAAEAAFGARDELEAVRRGYTRNRTYLLDSYPKSAAQTFIRRAAGAMPYWPLQQRRGSRRPRGSTSTARGHRTLRLSFAGSSEDMREAVTRLRAWLGETYSPPVSVAFARCHQPPRFGRSGSASVITF